MLVVPRGITVLQAVPASFAHPPAMSSAAADFFVLKDHMSLLGSDITNPRSSIDSASNPDVKFGFSATGKRHFYIGSDVNTVRANETQPATPQDAPPGS